MNSKNLVKEFFRKSKNEYENYRSAMNSIKEKEINEMTEQEIYKAAIDKYGKNQQMMMCIEEMSELAKELCKNIRGRSNEENIAEEIADVQIMLNQMMIIHKCETAVYFWEDEKLQRLKKRIEQEK